MKLEKDYLPVGHTAKVVCSGKTSQIDASQLESPSFLLEGRRAPKVKCKNNSQKMYFTIYNPLLTYFWPNYQN